MRKILLDTRILFFFGLVGSLLAGACQPEAEDSETLFANEKIRNRGEGKDNWYDALPRPAWSEFELVEQSQPWFEVYEVVSDVFAIYEPGQFEEVISYLLVGDESALLFDTGLGIGNMRQLVSELTTLEILVVNSHTHYDHIGGNYQFQSIYGVNSDYSVANTAGRTHEEVEEFVSNGWIWKPVPDGFSKADYAIEPFAFTRFLSDGETIDIGGRVLEVVVTPGHAPDALCLLDREHRLLFVGDTFYPASLYAHLDGSDFSLYAESAARMAALVDEVDFILPAHNEPLLESKYLTSFSDAFAAMMADTLEFVITDENREYVFDGFSIVVTDPPPWMN